MRTFSSISTAWPCSSNAITTTAVPYQRHNLARRRNSASPSLRLIELTIGLPCIALRPASMTDHLLLSTITGTAATSCSPAMSRRYLVMTASPSSRASSMLMSMMFAPPSTCERAISTASSYFSSLTSRANLREPVTFVRSPIMRKLLSGRSVSGRVPLSRMYGSGVTRLVRLHAAESGGHRADVIRRGAAATADDVDPAAVPQIRRSCGPLRRDRDRSGPFHWADRRWGGS